MKELIQNICGKLLYDTANDTNIYEDDILAGYKTLLNDWILNYSNYRNHSGTLLGSFEKNFNKGLLYSLHTYINSFEDVIKLPTTGALDLSILEMDLSDNVVENYKYILTNSIDKAAGYRLSDLDVETGHLSEQAIKELIGTIIDKLEKDATNMHWDSKQLNISLLDLSILRGLCNQIGQPSLFYHALNIFFDKLCISGMSQAARDLCEEMLVASFKDDLAFYGFFICFRVYSNLGSTIAALLYGNLCLAAVKSKEKIQNDKFLYEIIWQSLKLLRNSRLYPFAVQIYEKTPKTNKFSKYEWHGLDLVYYSCLFQLKEQRLPTLIFDYLGMERESILQEGEKGCSRWLLLLYNIKRLEQLFDFTGSGLYQYVNLFESIVPKESISKYRNIIEGDSGNLKDYLKESLLKLLATRNKSDFVYDNEMAIKIAHRLIEDSFDKKDHEAALLAMLVLSDHSILFKGKDSPDVAILNITDTDNSTFYEHFPDPVKALNSFCLTSSQALICLFTPEDKLLQLTYSNSNFNFIKIEDWDLIKFQKWSREIIPELDFQTTIKNRYDEVRSLLSEDYEHQANVIKGQVAFPSIRLDKCINELLVVKDMEVSSLPHNLILNESREFFALNSSVTNVLSIEWLNSKLSKKLPILDNSKALWIPLDKEDATIDFLYRKCQDVLDEYKVKISDTVKIESPLSSTINIISSHGSRDIASVHVVHPNDETVLYNLDKVVGNGKILIMLVCFSGSAKKDFFRNEITSLVKKFLASDYEAVIAPFWALHIDIPPIWLRAFFESIDSGQQVSNAVLSSNKAVFDRYPTPSAWACMHLYGNPFFKIGS